MTRATRVTTRDSRYPRCGLLTLCDLVLLENVSAMGIVDKFKSDSLFCTHFVQGSYTVFIEAEFCLETILEVFCVHE